MFSCQISEYDLCDSSLLVLHLKASHFYGYLKGPVSGDALIYGSVYTGPDPFGLGSKLVRISLVFTRELVDPVRIGSVIRYQMGPPMKVILYTCCLLGIFQGGQNLLLCKFLLLFYCFRTKFQGGANVFRGGKLPQRGRPPVEESQYRTIPFQFRTGPV